MFNASYTDPNLHCYRFANHQFALSGALGFGMAFDAIQSGMIGCDLQIRHGQTLFVEALTVERMFEPGIQGSTCP